MIEKYFSCSLHQSLGVTAAKRQRKAELSHFLRPVSSLGTAATASRGPVPRQHGGGRQQPRKGGVAQLHASESHVAEVEERTRLSDSFSNKTELNPEASEGAARPACRSLLAFLRRLSRVLRRQTLRGLEQRGLREGSLRGSPHPAPAALCARARPRTHEHAHARRLRAASARPAVVLVPNLCFSSSDLGRVPQCPLRGSGNGSPTSQHQRHGGHGIVPVSEVLRTVPD